MGWTSPPDAPELDEGDIHIWSADLSAAPDVDGLAVILDHGERLRADGFIFDDDRRRFIASHAVLRIIMACYTGERPESIRFRQNRWGKPSLARPGASFSMSHSGALALYAVARGREVGIDLEEIRAEFPGFDIARRFFSPREVESLSALGDDAKTAAFFNCWVRKEALVKALGMGLKVPLDAFDVSLEPGAPPALLEARFETDDARRWAYVEVPTIEGYAAALAVDGPGAEAHAFAFPPEWLR